MPLYEYQCKKCKHRFERIQKFSDPHVNKCPKCNAKVELVISAPAVQFKGQGWYVTDYGKKPITADKVEYDDKHGEAKAKHKEKVAKEVKKPPVK